MKILSKNGKQECITNSIMLNIPKGIKNKVTLPKIIAIKLWNNFNLSKNKSYKNTNISIN